MDGRKELVLIAKNNKKDILSKTFRDSRYNENEMKGNIAPKREDLLGWIFLYRCFFKYYIVLNLHC